MKGIKKSVTFLCIYSVHDIHSTNFCTCLEFKTKAAHGSMFHPHAWMEPQEKLPSNKKCSALSIKCV